MKLNQICPRCHHNEFDVEPSNFIGFKVTCSICGKRLPQFGKNMGVIQGDNYASSRYGLTNYSTFRRHIFQ